MTTGFPVVVRQLVMARAAGRCELCWVAVGGLQCHHRRPRGMGSSRRQGTNTASNCLLVCQACHNTIESHRTYARERGWLVSQWDRPAEVRVLRWDEWVYLADDGTVSPAGRKAGA